MHPELTLKSTLHKERGMPPGPPNYILGFERFFSTLCVFVSCVYPSSNEGSAIDSVLHMLLEITGGNKTMIPRDSQREIPRHCQRSLEVRRDSQR